MVKVVVVELARRARTTSTTLETNEGVVVNFISRIDCVGCFSLTLPIEQSIMYWAVRVWSRQGRLQLFVEEEVLELWLVLLVMAISTHESMP